MKSSYDFSRGTRGRIVKPEPEPAGKVKITIRLDRDIVDHFLEQADASGGSIGYQNSHQRGVTQVDQHSIA